MKRSLLLSIYIFLLIILSCRIILVEKTGRVVIEPPSLISNISESLRSDFGNLYSAILTPRSSSLVMGMLWGDQSGFTRKEVSLLRNSGLSHVSVASGMNLVLLVGILSIILPKKRSHNISITIIIILIYTIVTGFQPPIVRAAVMAIVSQLAILSGRPTARFGSLLFTAYILLFIEPELIYSISFQLSFLATLGQVFLSIITADIKRLNSFIISDITQTIMAQTFTLPVLVSAFGYYPVISIIVNGLVLWTVPWFMILGTVAGFAGLVSISLGRIVGIPIEGLSFYFWQVIGLFSGNNGTLLRISNLNPIIYLAYYLIILGLLFLVLDRKQRHAFGKEK